MVLSFFLYVPQDSRAKHKSCNFDSYHSSISFSVHISRVRAKTWTWVISWHHLQNSTPLLTVFYVAKILHSNQGTKLSIPYVPMEVNGGWAKRTPAMFIQSEQAWSPVWPMRHSVISGSKVEIPVKEWTITLEVSFKIEQDPLIGGQYQPTYRTTIPLIPFSSLNNVSRISVALSGEESLSQSLC